ncbi:hypothetical protein LLEC1_07749 [Akanthomyces lecanii]|uniref:Uncharacterized protein n=1 Tax=Cordyceps confragosa TaxID=2714763 RepID=A0A179IAD0_CORDF|nr:hypothetical protein LLEC1_07749 [Akanthomyces lecanii]
MTALKYSSLVLDLGGVLLNTPKVPVDLSPRKVKDALDMPTWHEYETGKLPQHECYDRVAKTFGLDVQVWAETMLKLTVGQEPNTELIAAIRELKSVYPGLRVICLSNIPEPAFELLRELIEGWGIMDQVHVSAISGFRKPNTAAFRDFLSSTHNTSESCIFVDDRIENVISAQCLGFQALLFQNTVSTVAAIHNLLGDPVARGMTYLKQHAGNLFSMTDDGQVHKDNFSQLLILQNTGDKSLVSLEKRGHTWNYFIGEPRLYGTTYANDSDTTCLALTILDDVPEEEKAYAMNAILANLSPDGLPYTWFDDKRPRLCHCICANVYRFFHLQGQAGQLPGVYEHLCRILRTGAFALGSRYYANPDWFLYTLSDLCGRRPLDTALQEMRELLGARIQDRMGGDDDVLGAALRLLSAQSLAVKNQRDLTTVRDAQQLDGGWEMVWLWQTARGAIKMGSRGVITAMAVRGIQNAESML